jgi:hypothetical protein
VVGDHHPHDRLRSDPHIGREIRSRLIPRMRDLITEHSVNWIRLQEGNAVSPSARARADSTLKSVRVLGGLTRVRYSFWFPQQLIIPTGMSNGEHHDKPKR